MKLSKKEQQYTKDFRLIKPYPILANLKDYFFTPTVIHSFKPTEITHAIEHLISIYINDCTVSYSKAIEYAINSVGKKVEANSINKYLNEHLLISEKKFNKTPSEKRKFLFLGDELYDVAISKYYLNEPQLFIQRLTYCCCYSALGNVYSKTILLHLPEPSLQIMQGTINLLLRFPNLPNETICKILSYRLGIPYEIVKVTVQRDLKDIVPKKYLRCFSDTDIISISKILAKNISSI